MPADIGQAAKQQAEDFKKALNITGVIITRMDSTAKGGGALTACAETNAPVYFITTGEKINDPHALDEPPQDATLFLEAVASGKPQFEQRAADHPLSVCPGCSSPSRL